MCMTGPWKSASVDNCWCTKVRLLIYILEILTEQIYSEPSTHPFFSNRNQNKSILYFLMHVWVWSINQWCIRICIFRTYLRVPNTEMCQVSTKKNKVQILSNLCTVMASDETFSAHASQVFMVLDSLLTTNLFSNYAMLVVTLVILHLKRKCTCKSDALQLTCYVRLLEIINWFIPLFIGLQLNYQWLSVCGCNL